MGRHTAPEPAETAEFTLKAVLAGLVLGVVFGAANAYLGLKIGMTVTASIPAAVMTVVAFRALGRPGTILEANLSQTIGSASTSLATGTIFTIPALFLWGVPPPYLQVVALCFLGGVLGITAMIPLRRLLVVEERHELPYPEGTACAEVLKSSQGGSRQGVWIFRGIALGIAVKLALSLLHLVPDELRAAVPVLPRAELALEISPALVAVGYILGYRQAAVCVAGSLISALVLTPLIAWFGQHLAEPLYPETVKRVAEMSSREIWSRYVRYIGAGTVAVAGVLTLALQLPKMSGSFLAVARGLARRRRVAATHLVEPPRTERDLPAGAVVGGVLFVILAAALVPQVFGAGLGPLQRGVLALGAGLFGVLFVTVAARIVGIVGVSSQPTSGVALVTLLGIASVFAVQGWTDLQSRAAVLTVGTLVAIAASKAGDISQDLKTGFLVGATPYRQQLGQLLGAAVACWAVAGTVLLLGNTYEFGSTVVPAPQAMLMKTIVEGVLAGELPWGLVATGGGLAVGAMLCGVSGLAFAIGVYLPLGSMMALFLGGFLRRFEATRDAREEDPGVLAASGLVAGEGLAGIAIALLAFLDWIPRSSSAKLAGTWGEIGSLLLVAVSGAFLLRAARNRPAAG